MQDSYFENYMEYGKSKIFCQRVSTLSRPSSKRFNFRFDMQMMSSLKHQYTPLLRKKYFSFSSSFEMCFLFCLPQSLFITKKKAYNISICYLQVFRQNGKWTLDRQMDNAGLLLAVNGLMILLKFSSFCCVVLPLSSFFIWGFPLFLLVSEFCQTHLPLTSGSLLALILFPDLFTRRERVR